MYLMKLAVLTLGVLGIHAGVFAQTISSVEETALVAADFYVSNAGNDAWDGMAAEYSGGTSGPWKTLNKVNQQMSQIESRSVLFRRGDRF